MAESAARMPVWARVTGAAALLLIAPFAALSLLLLLTGRDLGAIVYLWLALSIAAGAAGFWLIRFPNWARCLLAVGYAVLITFPLIVWTMAFGCGVYGLCP